MARMGWAAAALALAGGSVQAATVKVEIAGTVASVQDEGGATFGGSVEVGDAFALSFLYDTTIGVPLTSPGSNPGSQVTSLNSGEAYGAPSGIGATFSIAGQTFSVAGEEQGNVVLATPGGISTDPTTSFARYASYDANTAGSVTTQLAASFDIYEALGIIPFNIAQSYSIDLDAEADVVDFGFFYLIESEAGAGTNSIYTYLGLGGTSLTATVLTDEPAPIPLPASALLLAGALGGLGLVRRRRTG